jgi:hypothetical protein
MTAAIIARGNMTNIPIVSSNILSLYRNIRKATGTVNIVKKRYIFPVFVRYMSAALQSGQLNVLPSTLSIGALTLDIGNFHPQKGHLLERSGFTLSIVMSHVNGGHIGHTHPPSFKNTKEYVFTYSFQPPPIPVGMPNNECQ